MTNGQQVSALHWWFFFDVNLFAMRFCDAFSECPTIIGTCLFFNIFMSVLNDRKISNRARIDCVSALIENLQMSFASLFKFDNAFSLVFHLKGYINPAAMQNLTEMNNCSSQSPPPPYEQVRRICHDPVRPILRNFFPTDSDQIEQIHDFVRILVRICSISCLKFFQICSNFLGIYYRIWFRYFSNLFEFIGICLNLFEFLFKCIPKNSNSLK